MYRNCKRKLSIYRVTLNVTLSKSCLPPTAPHFGGWRHFCYFGAILLFWRHFENRNQSFLTFLGRFKIGENPRLFFLPESLARSGIFRASEHLLLDNFIFFLNAAMRSLFHAWFPTRKTSLLEEFVKKAIKYPTSFSF